MNNHNHHNNEPLYDEHPLEGLIERALLHREGEGIDSCSTDPPFWSTRSQSSTDQSG